MIAIITYDAPHRKTQDLVMKLMLSGYKALHLVVLPWIERQGFQPVFTHRPSNRVDVKPETLCERLGLSYSKVESEELDAFFTQHDYKHILIAGAGLLPDTLAQNHKVINAHPGYLPFVKGLDALKWAIYEDQPIGVTTHYISEKADEGQLIEKRLVPVYMEDSFHGLAYRVYETELEMLVNAISLIDTNEAPLTSLADNEYPAHRRMSNEKEYLMMARFDRLRQNSKSRNNQ